jgi:hypothetical protein
MNNGTSHKLRKGIHYHDHLAIFVKLDAEWTRHRRKEVNTVQEAYTDCQRRFSEVCGRFADGIGDNHREFWKANHPGKRLPHRSWAPQDWLYHPMFFVPFGHADALAVCLLDDLEPVPHVLHNIHTTIEDVNLAFCPVLKSLDLVEGGPLCPIRQLFQGLPRPRVPKSGTPNLSAHPAQQEAPLAVFTQFKLDGLLLLGQALLFQKALFKVMGQRILEVLSGLESDGAKRTSPELFPDVRDIKVLRCCLLDLQGSEEVGTFIVCRNFSTALTCVEALRRLTYGEVVESDPVLRTLFHNSRACWNVMRVYERESGGAPPQSGDLKALYDNHVFRWTHTTLAVSPEELFTPSQTGNCSGFVEALSQFQTAPGHRQEVEQGLLRAKCTEPINSPEGDNYIRIQVGTGDTLVPHMVEGHSRKLPLVPISSVIKSVRAWLTEFGTVRPHDPGRSVVDMATQLIVPVPNEIYGVEDIYRRRNLIGGPVGARHFAALVEVLKGLRLRLCYPRVIGSGRTNAKLPEGASRLSIDRLTTGLKQCGVPVALRRRIETLYQDFAVLIADPFMFDTVLDLYDALATFHAVISDHLPDVRARELGHTRGEFLGTLDTPRVKQLSEFADVLYSAMRHRLAKAYLDVSVREMQIDLHAGFNQLLTAADASLKCGLGLVRKFVRGTDERHTVGGLTRIGVMPGARFRDLELGTEDKANLGYIDADVPHVLHPSSYIDYLHEAFHLVLDAVINKRKTDPTARKLKDPSLDPLLRDRLVEIFALVLCRFFVFANDSKAFAQSHLVAFDRSSVIDGTNALSSVFRTSEVLARLFFASGGTRGKPGDFGIDSITRCTEDDLLTSFDAFLNAAGPMLRGYDECWHGLSSPGGKYCWNLVKGMRSELASWLPWLYERASEIFSTYRTDAAKRADPYNSSIYKQVCKAIQTGFSLSISLDGGNGDIEELDPLALVCRVLQYYLGTITAGEGKALHLKRVGADLKIDYSCPPAGRQWYMFQADRAVSSMFCPVPKARSRRLRHHIAMFKSFWNIAAVLRARRLNILVGDNWTAAELGTADSVWTGSG